MVTESTADAPRVRRPSGRVARAGAILSMAGALARRAAPALLLLAMAGTAGELGAQNLISVPFTNGFVGNRASSAGTSNDVKSYATLGIARTFFIQNSSTNAFELQGNDIPGTLRIVRIDGTTLDMPALANWRNSGGTTYLVGILPRPTAPVTLAYAGGSIQITDGGVSGGSSIGGYVAAHTGAVLLDGESTSGNAAQSQVLGGLNDYLATVVASRPAGPVTVTPLVTTSTTPTITGTATLAAGEQLTVDVGGVQYTATSTPAVVRSGTDWSLALTTPLSTGTHAVTATVTDADGFTLSDATTDELVIGSGGGTVTIGGTFTANGRSYDGTTTAKGTTTGLTLVGSAASDHVTLDSVSLAFQSAAAGSDRTVVITGVTLAGADAAKYTVSLAGAPTATATIAPRPLTIGGSFAVADRPFDGTTGATITANDLTLVGRVGSDDVALAGLAASFGDAAVGTGKPVALTAASLTGSAAANYTVGLAGAPTTTASITAIGGTVTLGGSFTASDRQYDGTTAASGATAGVTLLGVSPSDEVTIAGVTLGFESAAAGSAKTVVVTGVTLGGADSGAYTVSLAGAPTATASITPRPLAIGGTFTAADKPFDGTNAATIATSALTLVGAVTGDDVALGGLAAAFSDETVGAAKPVSLTAAELAGAAAANYALALAGAPTTTASILDASPPGAPRDVGARAGEGEIAVTWDMPAAVGCAAVTGWVVEHSTDAGQSWTRATVATAAPTATVLAGLANHVAHVVRVAATNACGTGAFSSAVGPVVPVAPTRDGAGQPVTSPPGTATSTSDGVPQPVTTEIVQDTLVRVQGDGFTLRLGTSDQAGAPIPLDDAHTVQLEQGGWARVDGEGFAPGTFVTTYLVATSRLPALLGTVAVGPDGAFAATQSIADTLAAGDYTLQVTGLDAALVPRAIGLGVVVGPPPPDLVLTATPDQPSPAVGDTVVITLTVTNQGAGPAIDVAIPRAFTEPGFTLLRTTALEGTYDPETQTWTIARIEPGARARMLLTAIVEPPLAPADTVPPESAILPPGAQR